MASKELPPIRLAFSGAAGTGKTTLAELVSEKTGLPICPVGSRTVCRAMGYDNPYDVDAKGGRLAFQIELMKRKAEWEQAHHDTGFITDRSHFDNLAYTVLHMRGILRNAQDPQPYAGTIADLLQLYVRAQSIYTHVVYFNIASHQKLGDDVDRMRDEHYHVFYELVLKGLHTYFTDSDRRYNYKLLYKSDVYERWIEVLQFLEGA